MAKKTKQEKLTKEKLRELLEEATVDCYDEEEEMMGLMAMIEENLETPFETKVLGMPVTVTSVEQGRGREIVAICERGREKQAISIADLPLPSPPPKGWEWIEVYRYYASSF